MYAGKYGDDWVTASKGCQLKPQDIVALVEKTSNSVVWENMAPAFKIGKSPEFTVREIPALGVILDKKRKKRKIAK